MLKPGCQQKETNPYGNRRIGNIECRVVIFADKKIEKIDHMTKPEPVDQVPYRPAGNEPERRYIQETAITVLVIRTGEIPA